MPFALLDLKDYEVDELKDIAQEMVQKNPGFYFLINRVRTCL